MKEHYRQQHSHDANQQLQAIAVYNNTPPQNALSLQQIRSDEIHIMASSHPSFNNQNGSVVVPGKVSSEMADRYSRLADAGDISWCRKFFSFNSYNVICTDYLLSDSFRGLENEVSQCPIGGHFLGDIHTTLNIEHMDQISAFYHFFP